MPIKFPQLFHSPSTGDSTAVLKERLDILQADHSALKLELTLLRRNLDDLEEKHSRRLNSLRAQFQQRKAGKFGPEDAPSDTNGSPSDASPSHLSHREIEALARQKGLL